jgi:hypothetical protein
MEAFWQREVTMCLCASPTDLACSFEVSPNVAPRSLRKEAIREAEEYKWIESEKAGRDLGENAIWGWVQRHWNGFLRAKWLEHLEGVNFWVELKHEDFGLLTRQFQGSPFIGEIVRQLKTRGENLSIILWALEKKCPMDEIRAILKSLDINSARIELELAHRLLSHDN